MSVTGLLGSAPRGEIIGWVVAFALAASAFGADWLGTTVQVPLWGVLVLTFVPTMDLIDVTRAALDNIRNRVEAQDAGQG